MINRLLITAVLIFNTSQVFAKFTQFERMNDLFFEENYIEIEYNYYILGSEAGFTDYDSALKFAQYDDENTSKRVLHELSISASDIYGFSLLANIMSNQLNKLDEWGEGYSINRYNFSALYDVYEIKRDTKFYKFGFAYEYQNFKFSNPAAKYEIIVNATGTYYTDKQSFDFITHDLLVYCVIGWPKWGDLSNLYITVRGGPSWLETDQNTMSIIYESDPRYDHSSLPDYSAVTEKSVMKDRGFTAGLGAHYITKEVLSVFTDFSFSFWDGKASGEYYDPYLNIMRYKFQVGLGLHFGKNVRAMASVVSDNFECDRDLSNYEYNYGSITVRFSGYQYGITIAF